MLYITKEQMIRADEKARVHFHRRVRDYVREKMPEETRTTPNTKLLTYLGEQDKIAAEHGITSELGVSKWACLSLWAGEEFYQQPEFNDYFEQPGEPSAEMRLDFYVDYICALEKDPKARIEDVVKKHGYIPGS